jgi:endonuclease YncB( thermonuclease family)
MPAGAGGLYNNADDIPASVIKSHGSIYGRVIKVVDGDTMRIRHLPWHPFPSSSSYTGKLSDNTISVRIYGVDAPEVAKFGNPDMFMGQEAKVYVEKRVDGKVVKVKLLRKDQYGRVVGNVSVRRTIPFLPRMDLSMDLAKNGLATLYTGGGAEYDGHKEALISAIETAQKKKMGVWSNGVENMVSPAQYKQDIKANKQNNKNRKFAGAAVVY